MIDPSGAKRLRAFFFIKAEQQQLDLQMAQPPLLITWYATRRFAVLLLCDVVSSCPEPHVLVLAVQRSRTEQQIPHVLRSMLFPAVKLMCWTDSPYYMSAQDIRDLPRDMFADLYTVSVLLPD